jgi:hypothetical protein
MPVELILSITRFDYGSMHVSTNETWGISSDLLCILNLCFVFTWKFHPLLTTFVRCVLQLAGGLDQGSSPPLDRCSDSAMALRRAVYRNNIATLLKRSVTVTSAVQRSLSNYFPIDEHIFGLTQEQTQVIKHLYIFHPIQYCLQNIV